MDRRLSNRFINKSVSSEALAIKALRLTKGLSRREAGALCGCSARAFEQLENGRCGFTGRRTERIIGAMGFSMADFDEVVKDPHSLIKALESNEPKEVALKERKERRSCFRIITKEVRVLRILRERRGLTQNQASVRCGYTYAILGQIENGRINIPHDRIKHIVKSLGYRMDDYEKLMQSEILRDEIISECNELMSKLDDPKLASVRTILKSLRGAS